MHKLYRNLSTNAISFKSSSKNCSHILNTNVGFAWRIMNWNKCWPQAANKRCKRDQFLFCTFIVLWSEEEKQRVLMHDVQQLKPSPEYQEKKEQNKQWYPKKSNHCWTLNIIPILLFYAHSINLRLTMKGPLWYNLCIVWATM